MGGSSSIFIKKKLSSSLRVRKIKNKIIIIIIMRVESGSAKRGEN